MHFQSLCLSYLKFSGAMRFRSPTRTGLPNLYEYVWCGNSLAHSFSSNRGERPASQETMANVSDDLLWSLVRSNTSFLYKRNGRTKRSGKVVLSSEPNNLMNKNSYKYSGLANSKAVGIQFDKDTKGRPCAAICLKSSKKSKKPKKSVGKSLLKKTFPSVSQAIVKQTAGACYRPDLKHAALVRWSKVHLALRVKKGEKKSMAISVGRKNLKAA